MFQKILVLISFIIFSSPLLAQTNGSKYKLLDQVRIKCTYLLKYQRDSTNKESISTEDMILLIGDSVLKFQSLNSYLRDSIQRVTQFSNVFEGLAQLKAYSTKFFYKLFKNYPKNKMTFTDKIPPKNYFLIQQPLNLFTWHITNDTLSISGYHCQKATTHFAGRNYIAWFTTEVPVSEGPYKFNGLPGLIVKIGDSRQQYVFELTGLERIKTQIPILFTERNYINTTQKKFDKAYRNFIGNFRERMARRGITINVSDKYLKKRLRRNNNAIEIGY